jgi:peptidoglycan/LPS O-acetylase OafA/YrhL
MRRARRILPGYYAALLLLPIFYLAIDSLKHFLGEGGNWTRTIGLIFSTDMVLHLFLLQNLSNTWTFSGDFNMVLWIVVTEWWIYFVFALVLLPVWRRLGATVATCGSIVIGLLPPAMQLLDWPTLTGCPHLVGAFGLGMMSAVVVHKYNHSFQLAVPRRVLIIVMTLSIVSVFWISLAAPAIRLSPGTRWITDYLIAIVCATFFLLTASTVIANLPSANLATIAIRILEWRPMVLIGQFSYSLYLTHLVVWAMLGITLNLAPVKQLVLFSLNPLTNRILLLIPVQIVFAYGFSLLFEKPVLRYRN